MAQNHRGEKKIQSYTTEFKVEVVEWLRTTGTFQQQLRSIVLT